MLKQYKEADFYLLKKISKNRLSPDQMVGFFWGALIYSAVMAIVSYNAIQSIYITDDFWTIIVKSLFGLLVVQLLITLFYSSAKNAYRFQKSQIYWLNLIVLKISLEMYLIYFLTCDDRNVPSHMTIIGFLLLLGGLVYLAISTIRGIYRVKIGEFRQGGKGLYNFQQSKGYLSLPVIYGAVVFGGVLGRYLPTIDNLSNTIEVLVPLAISVAIQYSIAIAWPEFLLLAYCKTRFKSFNKIPRNFQ